MVIMKYKLQLKFKLHFPRYRSSNENISKAVLECVLEIMSLTLALKVKSLLTTLANAQF